MNPTLKILEGDCIARLRELPDNSVHCCVTSPPYWGLRDYGVAGQIGLEPTIEEYVAKMVEVFREVRRVLRPDGTCFINLGDSYFGGGRGGNPEDSPYRKQATNAGSLIKRKAANAKHAIPYDTSGKAPANSQENGCLCGNLCGVCREVYRRTTHTDPMIVAMLRASIRETIPSSTECQSDHLPTLGSCPSASHMPVSSTDLCDFVSPSASRLRASLESMLGQSSSQFLDECLRRGSRDECLLCGRSLTDNVPMSSCKTASPFESQTSAPLQQDQTLHTSCISETGGASVGHISGMASCSCSYQHLTTSNRPCQLKPKDLCGIPWRVALALQADGWYLRSDIIWHKPNPMPESVTDRPTKSHEYMFLLTKNERYFYDTEAINEQQSQTTFDRFKNGCTRKPSKKHIGTQEECLAGHETQNAILANGRNKRSVWTVPEDEWQQFLEWKRLHSGDKKDVWTVPSAPYKEAHFATYPPDLIKPCILAGTSARGACKCGAPWERVLEATEPRQKLDYNGKHSTADKSSAGRNILACVRAARESGADHDNPFPPKKTLGWQPTCECGETQTVPCVVCDPFGGSGTTGQVALELGRSALLIELNPEYLKLGLARTDVTPGLPLA